MTRKRDAPDYRANHRIYGRVISRTPVTLLAAASLAFGSGTLRAQQRDLAARLAPGFYAGAELGGTGYDNACDPAALSCDHTDGAGAAFGGYRFASRFAIELGGRHLGDARAVYPRLTGTNEVVGQVEGYDVSGLLRFPFGRAWEAYVRGGAFHADAHTRSPESSSAESDWSPAGGGGFAWTFRPAWQARFQYLYLSDVGDPETGEANVNMLSMGVSYLFGGRRRAAAAVATAASSEPEQAPAAPPPAPPPPAAAPPPLPLCAPALRAPR